MTKEMVKKVKLRRVLNGKPNPYDSRIYDGHAVYDTLGKLLGFGVIDVDGDGEEYAFSTDYFEIVDIIEEDGN